MKDFTVEQLKWLEDNKDIFTANKKPTTHDKFYIYSIYNHLFGTKKEPNSCGSCWRNTKKSVLQQLNKLNLF